jgi:hypothetical protein
MIIYLNFNNKILKRVGFKIELMLLLNKNKFI